MRISTSEPKVYVACLAAYSSGKLHGEWCDATDEDEIEKTIERVIETSPVEGAEEHAFHDYDDFGGISMGEYESIENIVAIAKLIDEHGAAIVAALHGHGFTDPEKIEELIGQQLGVFNSNEAYAEHLWSETRSSEIPEDVWRHIDWESVAIEMETGGEFFTVRVGSDLHFFPN